MFISGYANTENVLYCLNSLGKDLKKKKKKTQRGGGGGTKPTLLVCPRVTTCLNSLQLIKIYCKNIIYLNCIVNVTWLFLQVCLRWTFICKVIQLTGALSLIVWRAHIYGQTVRLQKTLHTAAPFICHLRCSYHVTRKYLAFYWILEDKDCILLQKL